MARAVASADPIERTKRVSPGLAVTVPLAFAAAVLGGFALGGFSLAVAGGSVVILAGVFTHACGLRASLVMVALLGLSPSVFGESSLSLSFASAVVLLTVVLSAPSDTRVSTSVRGVAIFVPLCVGFGLLIVDTKQGASAVIYLLLAFAVGMIVGRRALMGRVLKAFAIFVTIMSCSYLVSLLTGFQLNLGELARNTARHIDVYAPFTPTTGGTMLLGVPRLVLMVGEPGLGAFFLIPAFVYFAAHSSKRVRILGCLTALSAVAFSQSAGVIISTLVAAAVGVIYALIVRRRWFLTLVAVSAVGIAVPRIIQILFDYRLEHGAVSITDRGIADAGSASAASLGNINLLVAIQHSPLLGAALFIALIVLVPLAVRTAVGVFAFTLFSITAGLLQPSQWQYGAWLLILVSLGWLLHERADKSAP